MRALKNFFIFIFTIILFASCVGYGISKAAQATKDNDVADIMLDKESTTALIDEFIPVDQLVEAGIPKANIDEIKNSDEFKNIVNQYGSQALTQLMNQDTPFSKEDIQSSLNEQIDNVIDSTGVSVSDEVKESVKQKVEQAVDSEAFSTAYNKVIEKIPASSISFFQNFSFLFEEGTQTLCLAGIIISFIMLIILRLHIYKWLLITSLPILFAGIGLKITAFVLPLIKGFFATSSNTQINNVIEGFVSGFANRISPYGTWIMMIGIVLCIIYIAAKLIYRQYHPDDEEYEYA